MLDQLRNHGFSDREIIAFEGGYERLVRESENPEFARRQAQQQHRNHVVRIDVLSLFSFSPTYATSLLPLLLASPVHIITSCVLHRPPMSIPHVE